MSELVAGGNRELPDGALTIRVPGPFDLSFLITDDSGKVSGDADFVFFNQPSAPGARLNGDTLIIDPRRLRPGASRATVAVSPSDSGTPFGRLPVPAMSVTGRGGVLLARFTPPRPTRETVVLLAEVYLRGTGWKLRALGQGYADGLAGVARDFGVDVTDDGTAPPPPPAPTPSVRVPSAVAGLDRSNGFTTLVNAERSRAGAPPVTLDPRLVAAAQAHSAQMAAQGRLSVEGRDGRSVFHRVAACGYTYLSIAEHIVSGPRTPAEFVDYCLAGEARRRPLYDPSLTQVGIAHTVGGRSRDVYWTALWASPFTAAGLTRLTSEVVALTNTERAKAGLAPLADDPRLATAARAHSADMVARDFYSHTTPEGLEPWDRAARAGCAHRGIGENIACGQRTPAEVVRGWMDSPGHRANILKGDFTHIGIGYATGGAAGTYWTQLFGMSR